MEVELVSFRTTDEISLEAAIYSPFEGRSAATLVYLHGKGANFYSGPSRFIPERLATRPFRHVMVNMRCHDLGYSRSDADYLDYEAGGTSHQVDGGFWEDMLASHTDIDAVVRYSGDRWDERIVLVGHSMGGYYASAYTSEAARISARVLLSPVIDFSRTLKAWFPSESALNEAISRAQALIDVGAGDRLIPLPVWYYAISAQSLIQRLTLMRSHPSILHDALRDGGGYPTLLLWGRDESRAANWQALADEFSLDHADIPDANHYYHGKEAAVAESIAGFLATIGIR